MDLLEKYTTEQLIDIVGEDTVVSLLKDNSYYLAIAGDLIRQDIIEQELDGLDDINDNDILVNAYCDLVGADDLVNLFLMNGYDHDISLLICEKYYYDLKNLD